MNNGNKLKLIKSPEILGESNSFWKVCPRSLQFLPERHCEKGKPNMDGKLKRVNDDPECKWWINSEKHNYCFWKYVHDVSNPDGVMPELVQSELARLFGWSNTKTHFALKEAIDELTKALYAYGALQLLNDMTNDEYQELLDDSIVKSEYEDPY